MNPCPCGYFTDPKRNCRCNSTKIERYLAKISGPLLDRIDLHIEVPSLKYKEIIDSQKSEPSSEIKERVEKTHNIQKQRFKNEKIYFNSHMNHKQIKKYCILTEETKEFLKIAMESMNLFLIPTRRKRLRGTINIPKQLSGIFLLPEDVLIIVFSAVPVIFGAGRQDFVPRRML